MFIFGWGTRQKLVTVGQFQCPVCRTNKSYQQISQRRWFTLFFIPLLPLSESQDFIRCDQCQTTIQTQVAMGHTASVGQTQLSYAAIVGMVLGLMSLFSFCLFFISIPLAIAAVVLGHVGWSTIRKNRPHMQGGWQAVTAMATGYSALLFSLTMVVLIVSSPNWSRDSKQFGSVGDSVAGIEDGDDQLTLSESTNQAFKNAEYEIAAKRDQPAGRGNSAKAVELANTFAERMKEVSDELFTSGRRPMLQLSSGEYLTYCELHDDRCLFLVHVPSYRKFNGDAKKALAQLAWAVAQSTTAGQMPGEAKLGVGLRGVLTYGDILLGDCPASTEDKITAFRSGKTENLLEFFEDDKGQVAASLATPSNAPSSNAPASGQDPWAGPSGKDPFDTVAPNAMPAEQSRPGEIATDSTPGTAQPSLAAVAADSEKPEVRKPPAKRFEFQNQIPVELAKSITNESWGYSSMAFSPDGKWLAAGKMDAALDIIEVETGETIRKLDKLEEFGQVNSLAFGLNSQCLVAGGHSGQVLSWKVDADGLLSEQQKLHRFETEIELLITSPKYPFFMAASRKGSIAWQSYGTAKSEARLMQEFKKNVRAVWLPSGGTEAMATDGLKLIPFSLRDGQLGDSKELGIKNAQLAAFSLSGKRLVIADFDSWHLIELQDRLRIRKVKLPPGGRLHSLQFHPNEQLVAAGVRGKVAIFDFEKAEIIAYAITDSIHNQELIAFPSDGKRLATTSTSARDSIKIFEFR